MAKIGSSYNKYNISLILPCYNETEHFEKSIKNIRNVLDSSGFEYEIIFVEDKSSDKTKSLIQKYLLKNKLTRIKAIYHKVNFGRGQSVTDGIKIAQGRYVGFMDIDCEVSPGYIPAVINKLEEGYDIVCGNRQYNLNFQGIIRATASKLYSFFVRKILKTDIPDTEAGYKFFRRNKILPIIKITRDKGWFWDTEVMVRSERNGLKIFSIPVVFSRRQDKTSTVNLLSDTISYIIKLIQFRQEYNNKNNFIFQIASRLRNVILPVSKINHVLSPNGLIYEIGCGYGSLAYALGDKFSRRQIIGLDIDKNKIIKSREKYQLSNIKYIHADVLKYPFHPFQGAVLSDFLHHLSYAGQIRLLNKITEKISKGGKIIIKEIDNNDGWRKTLSRLWDRLLYPGDTVNYRSKTDWIRVCNKFGYNVETSREIVWFPGSTMLFICTKK